MNTSEALTELARLGYDNPELTGRETLVGRGRKLLEWTSEVEFDAPGLVVDRDGEAELLDWRATQRLTKKSGS